MLCCRVSTGVLISPWPDQEGNKLMFLSEWREFPSAPCLARKKNLMTARVSMLLKSRASLTCFRACFFPGRTKDLSAPRYCYHVIVTIVLFVLLSSRSCQQHKNIHCCYGKAKLVPFAVSSNYKVFVLLTTESSRKVPGIFVRL